jgi:hypothetical protein
MSAEVAIQELAETPVPREETAALQRESSSHLIHECK